VGFYGGVNYGGGYYGHGYAGGRWSHNTFEYNTYVTRVNTTVVHNVYVDRSVTIVAPSHVSYNGGPHGIQAQPSAEQSHVAQTHHYGMTPVQQQHVQAAATDRRFLATVNHNQPPVPAVARPLSAPAPHDATIEHAAPPPVEHVARPMQHAAPPPVQHVAPPVQHVAPPAPVEHAPPAVRPVTPARKPEPRDAPRDAPQPHDAKRTDTQH
jgi:hypothetical protein